MPTDTASFAVTAAIAVPVPVITSGVEAIRVPREHHGAKTPATMPAEVMLAIAAVDPAIAQAPQGHLLLVDVLSVVGSHDPVARKYHHFGNYLLDDLLTPNHGQT